VPLATPARAQNYPWCAIYSGGAAGGGTNCGFVSYEQCRARSSFLKTPHVPHFSAKHATDTLISIKLPADAAHNFKI